MTRVVEGGAIERPAGAPRGSVRSIDEVARRDEGWDRMVSWRAVIRPEIDGQSGASKHELGSRKSVARRLMECGRVDEWRANCERLGCWRGDSLHVSETAIGAPRRALRSKVQVARSKQ